MKIDRSMGQRLLFAALVLLLPAWLMAAAWSGGPVLAAPAAQPPELILEPVSAGSALQRPGSLAAGGHLTPGVYLPALLQVAGPRGATPTVTYPPATPTATTATPALAAPSALTASAVSSTSIQLTWHDNASNETGFRIEQSLGSGDQPFSEIQTTGANITSLIVSGLSPLTTYTFRVRAYNPGGNSAYSNAATATTSGSLAPPSAPDNLSAVPAPAAPSTSVHLTWADNATNEQGFKIEQSTGASGTFVLVATLGADVQSATITGLAAGTTYIFRVRAYNSAGNSAPSRVATVTTAAAQPVPAAPNNMRITNVDFDYLGFAWNDNSGNETEFVIERSLDRGVTFETAGSVAANTTAAGDDGRTPGTYYCYRVRSRNAAGASNPSNTACYTTDLHGPPAAPANVSAQVISATMVLITWNNPTSNSGYRLYESVNGGGFVAVTPDVTPGNLDGVRMTFLNAPAGGTRLAYKVRSINSYGQSADSNTSNSVTMPGTTPATVTRFNNQAAYPIVSLQVDGVEQFPNAPLGVPSGLVYQLQPSVGTHSYRVATGFWNGATRFEMYIYRGSFTQQSGATTNVTINNPSMAQIMTRFGSSGYYVGEYWSGTILNSKAFRFYSNGSCKYYLNGVAQGGSCTFGQVPPYNGDFLVTLRVAYSAGTFDAIVDERYGYFYLRNGPPDWPTIEYNYDGP